MQAAKRDDMQAAKRKASSKARLKFTQGQKKNGDKQVYHDLKAYRFKRYGYMVM